MLLTAERMGVVENATWGRINRLASALQFGFSRFGFCLGFCFGVSRSCVGNGIVKGRKMINQTKTVNQLKPLTNFKKPSTNFKKP